MHEQGSVAFTYHVYIVLQHVRPDMGQHLVPLFSPVPLLVPMLGLVSIVQSMGSPSGSSIVMHSCEVVIGMSVAPFVGFGSVIVGGWLYVVVNVYVAVVVWLHEQGSVVFTYHV